jgi:hypothetical protein
LNLLKIGDFHGLSKYQWYLAKIKKLISYEMLEYSLTEKLIVWRRAEHAKQNTQSRTQIDSTKNFLLIETLKEARKQ